MKRILLSFLIFLPLFLTAQTPIPIIQPYNFQKYVLVQKYLKVYDTISCDSILVGVPGHYKWISPFTQFGQTYTASSGITLTGSNFTWDKTIVSAMSPLSYSNTTGVFSIQQAGTSQSGYLISTDWNMFNGKPDSSSLITNYDFQTGLTVTGNTGMSCVPNGSYIISGDYTAEKYGYMEVDNSTSNPLVELSMQSNYTNNQNTIDLRPKDIYFQSFTGTNIGSSAVFDSLGWHYGSDLSLVNTSNPNWLTPKSYVDSKAVGLGDTVKRFGSGNIKIGINNLKTISTGNSNIAIGDGSMYSVTSGYANIGIGSYTMNTLSTGLYNTSLGYYSLTSNTGSNNTALGAWAGKYNTSKSHRLWLGGLDYGSEANDSTKSPVFANMNTDMTKQTVRLNGIVTVNGVAIGASASAEDTLYISSANILSGINDTLVNTNAGSTQTIYTTCLINYRHVSTAYTGGTTDTITIFGKYKGVKKKLLYISSSYITDAYSGRGQFPIAWDKLDPGSPIWVHIPSFSTGNGILRMRFKKLTETW
jgi:hypothetical protein